MAGKKKQKISIGSLISDIKDSIGLNKEPYIPDIIEFCNSEDYLGFPYQKNPMKLKPAQQLILKVFYRGSRGNEHLQLTDEEIILCNDLGLINADRGNVLKKYFDGDVFRELVLVWGRRSGKDYTMSIIALYEAMKLLECPGGDPYAYYNIGAGNPIHLLTVANSHAQAVVAFAEIQHKLFASKYFSDKYIKDGLTQESVRLLTYRDKQDNAHFASRNMGRATNGSIVIEVGHSNSSTLLGKSIFVLMLDEVASYKNTGGDAGGERIYASLTPAIATYFRSEPVLDKKGNITKDMDGEDIHKVVFDGKIISISSPRGKEGKFWELFSTADLDPSRLACRLPTWDVIPERSHEALKSTYGQMSEEEFNMEFGAEFSGLAGENFFSEEFVNKCFKGNMKFKPMGRAGQVYFLHLDPASTSHNYALALVHKEVFLDEKTRQADYRVVVDLLKCWHPTANKPIIASVVDEFVIALKRMFRVGMVTFDAWNSLESKLRLQKAGLPSKETRFTNPHKMIIYSELQQLINAEKLIIPEDGPESLLLRNELIALQKKVLPRGYRIGPKKDGDGTKTDDMCVLPETLIHTPKGIKCIKDVRIGEKVLTHTGKFKKVTGVSARFTNDDLYCLKPHYSFSLFATSNHPIHCLRDNKVEWIPVSQIRKDDYILRSYPKPKKQKKTIDLERYNKVKVEVHANIMGSSFDDYSRVNKSELDVEYIRQNNGNSKWHKRYVPLNYGFGYISGLFLAEGSFHDHGIAFASHIKESSIRLKLSTYLSDIFGDRKRFLSIQQNNNACQLFINSQLIKLLFLDLFGHKAAVHKEIPLFVFSASREFKSYLLRGLFEGDGTRSEVSFVKKKQITFTTSSEKMAHQIQQLLLSLKIVSSISISRRKGRSGSFKNRVYQYNADLFNVRVQDAYSFNRLSKMLGYVIKKDISKFNKPKYKFVNGFLACKVDKIEKTNATDVDQSVYSTQYLISNISVEEDESFVANGLNVHNCDALAGACYSAINMNANVLPAGRLVDTGVFPQSNERTWMGMQGPIGSGTGSQVAQALENRQI